MDLVEKLERIAHMRPRQHYQQRDVVVTARAIMFHEVKLSSERAQARSRYNVVQSHRIYINLNSKVAEEKKRCEFQQLAINKPQHISSSTSYNFAITSSLFSINNLSHSINQPPHPPPLVLA